MKKPFYSELVDLTNKATKYLRQVIDRRGNYYELCDPQDDRLVEDIGGLADSGEVLCVSITDPDGQVEEHVAVEMRVDDEGDFMLVAESVAGNGESFRPVGELSAEDLCRLADWVFNLENPE